MVPLKLPTTTRRILRTAILNVSVFAGIVTPALAQHQARLSGDLANHLAAGSPYIEVIVDGDKATVDRLAAQYNVVVKRSLTRGGGVLVVNAGQLAALQSDPSVEHLAGNVRYRTSSDVAIAAPGTLDALDEGIGADQVWAGAGGLAKLSGLGVTVAVIDSGFDPNHHALKGRVLQTVDFTGGDGVDKFGHGTHVAAIIAGQRGLTADTQMYQGVAPGAYLLNLRVLGNDGSGSAADVIEAIDWAVDHRQQYNIRVINLSLGAPVLQPYRDDPVCAAVERAVRAGIFVVAAAGNHGQTADGKRIMGGIGSPGNSPYALTVGALDTKGTAERGDDVVAPFSSSGPTRYDLVIKPDLVAPGRRVTSAEAAGSLLSVNFPDQHIAGTGANAYIRGSGTSMATAVVSGAAALLIQERPGLRPLTTRAALELTSTFLPAAGLVQGGAGSLNVLAAAEFVLDGDLSNTTIAGAEAVASQIVIAPADQMASALGCDRSIAGVSHIRPQMGLGTKKLSPRRRIAPFTNTLVWGNGDTLVWGNTDTLVWGNTDTLVWGNTDTLVWGN
jgi:serine protease AprX